MATEIDVAALPADVRDCCETLVAKKAYDVTALRITALSSVADHFIVASGFSRIQVQAMADAVREHMRAHGRRELRGEGYAEARWICLDYGDTVIHLFTDEVRRYFDLERLWGDAPRAHVSSEQTASAAVV